MAFSITSYNILADPYIRLEMYPDTDPEMLVPTRRHPFLLNHLDRLATDILCLQEVEPQVLQAISVRLKPHEYDIYFRKKASSKTDGCATLIKKASFAVTNVDMLYYTDGQGDEPNTGHLALIVQLEHEGRALFVVNTHLKWDSPETPLDQQRSYRQISHLLSVYPMHQRQGPWILCGDFNAQPDSDVVKLLHDHGLDFAHRTLAGAYSCNSNRKAKLIDYLFHTPDLIAKPIPPSPLGDLTPLPSEQEPSDHLALQGWFEFATTE